jgi:hypothetical protein
LALLVVGLSGFAGRVALLPILPVPQPSVHDEFFYLQAADVFIILTVLATLGLGEHYFVDLLAAVPFWLAFEALWRWRRIRAFERL